MFDIVSVLIWLSLVVRSFHDLVMIASVLRNPILPLTFKQKRCYAWELTGKNLVKNLVKKLLILLFSDKHDSKYFECCNGL